jgi:hypothetical protein
MPWGWAHMDSMPNRSFGRAAVDVMAPFESDLEFLDSSNEHIDHLSCSAATGGFRPTYSAHNQPAPQSAWHG